MSGKILKSVFCVLTLLWVCFHVFTVLAGEAKEPGTKARIIPGITGEDPFPLGCVSCHINMPDKAIDTRFSTLMKQLAENVSPELLTKAQASSPAGVSLTGKHPDIGSTLGSIPASCLKCHDKTSRNAPYFNQMMHLIHLTGGNANHFMTLFQGECTYCHKLDPQSGAWTTRSGEEK